MAKFWKTLLKVVIPVVVAFGVAFVTPLGKAGSTWVRVHVFHTEEQNDGLRGTWDGRWTVDYGRYKGAKVIQDRIHIVKVRGEEFTGYGQISYSVPDKSADALYEVSGKAGRYAVEVTFHGQGKERDVVGVAILKPVVDGTRMQGNWWQFGRDGMIFGGSTTWTKRD